MVLDYISNFFYDPWTFWGVPLVFALGWEGCRRLGEKARSRSLGEVRARRLRPFRSALARSEEFDR